MSAHDTYVIRATQAGCVLLLNGQPVGSFLDRGEAERAALAAIEISRQHNRTAAVFTQDGDGVNIIAKTGAGLTAEVILRPRPGADGAASE
jgi:hypothetical protein